MIVSLSLDDLSMEACCAIKYFPEVDSLQSEKVRSLFPTHHSHHLRTNQLMCKMQKHLWPLLIGFPINWCAKTSQDCDLEAKRRAIEQAKEEASFQTKFFSLYLQYCSLINHFICFADDICQTYIKWGNDIEDDICQKGKNLNEFQIDPKLSDEINCYVI